jgi:trigger factor
LEVTAEKTAQCEYVLNLKVEPERLEKPLRQAAQRLSVRRPLAGFRPGKAPYALVERTFGKELIVDEMLDKIGNELYKEALEQNKLEPYDRASFEIVQLEPLTLKVTVPTQPVVTLGDYSQIRVETSPVTVSDAEVQELLGDVQKQHALWVPVERAVQMGDQVLIDAKGTGTDGQNVDKEDLTLEVKDSLEPPDFRQNLIGILPGATKEFEVQYPADFGDADLSGKQVHFSVTVQSVKQKELPALDDALAQSAGTFETLEQLRADLRSRLQEQKEAQAKNAATDSALDSLLERAVLEYPAVAVEHEVMDMLASLGERLGQQGFTIEGYLHSAGKTLDQLRDETRPQAEKRLKRALVLAKFAEMEDVKVVQEDVSQEVVRVSQTYGERADAVRSALERPGVLNAIRSDLYNRKVLDHLMEMAAGKAQPRSKKTETVTEDHPEEAEKTTSKGQTRKRRKSPERSKGQSLEQSERKAK